MAITINVQKLQNFIFRLICIFILIAVSITSFIPILLQKNLLYINLKKYINMQEKFNTDYQEEDNFLHQNARGIILKELISFGWKMRYVLLMLPQHRQQSINYLRKWDLWGPMIICLFFALPMAMVNDNPNYQQDFINVFLIFWLGSLLISINCKLLGSKGSLLLIVSTVGYCLIPLAAVGFITMLLHWILPTILKVIIIGIALFWSSISCMLIMRDLVSADRKWLCTYPIFLFYIFLAWYAIMA